MEAHAGDAIRLLLHGGGTPHEPFVENVLFGGE
jgi:hypothetical protein